MRLGDIFGGFIGEAGPRAELVIFNCLRKCWFRRAKKALVQENDQILFARNVSCCGGEVVCSWEREIFNRKNFIFRGKTHKPVDRSRTPSHTFLF